MAGECCVATALYPLALTCLANPATVPVTEAGRYLQPLMAALELGAAAGKGDIALSSVGVLGLTAAIGAILATVAYRSANV